MSWRDRGGPPPAPPSSSSSGRRGDSGGWGDDSSRRRGPPPPPPPAPPAGPRRGGGQDARYVGGPDDHHDDRFDRPSGGSRRFGGGGRGGGGGGGGRGSGGGWGPGSQPGRGPPPGSDRDPSDWRSRGPPEREEGPPPPPPLKQQGEGGAGFHPPRGGGGRGGREPVDRGRRGSDGSGGGNAGGGGTIRRGKDLPLNALETGAVYQALLYAAHEQHGFFAHLGVLEEQKGELRCFPASGRVARQGLPAGLVGRCERRVAEARGSGAGPGAVLRREWLCPVKVTSSGTDERSGKVRIELALVPTRKLLILDLNGVLFNRYPLGDERRVLKQVQKRPGCDAFLDFCFAHFDVAAWSCCRKETLELALFGPREPELVFVHHSAHSTNLWPRTSVVSPAKPLFLKQLPKLWAQYDRVDYGAANTILLDNHLEKFEGNPVGTCLVVPEYVDGSDPPDALLRPDGELTRHLAAMATAPDSAAYARATPSPFFPTAHPEPPVELAPVLKRALLEAMCASEVMLRERPELTVEHYMERHETPGPRAAQLRRRTLPDVAGIGAPPHVVCEKSDGTRLFLFLPDAALVDAELRRATTAASVPFSSNDETDTTPGTFFIDRHWQPEGVAARALRDTLSPRGGVTLLDGELLRPYPHGHDNAEEAEEEAADHIFLVFDVVLLDGEDVGAIPSIQQRMERLRAVLGEGESQATVAAFGKSRPGERVRIVPKVFYPLEDLRGLVETMLCPFTEGEQQQGGEGEEFVFDDGRRRTLSDGLVFTPAGLPYYLYQVHKYKTPRRISVDFKCKLADLGQAAATVPLYLMVNRADVAFTELDARRRVPAAAADGAGAAGATVTTLERLREHMEESAVGECIVECDLRRDTGLWVLRAVRADKKNPNSLQVCWNNLEAIAEGLELADVVDAIDALRLRAPHPHGPPPEEKDGEDGVAAHYDGLQARRWEGAEEALDPRIHNLRRLNNWIKTVVIETVAREGTVGGGAAADVDGDEDEDPAVGQRPNPLATRDQREAAAAATAPPPAAGGPNRRGRSLRVLDLACGRGGDVKKWVLQRAEVYVGVDVSPQSVLECRARAEESRRRTGRPKVALVLTRSMVDAGLPDAVGRALQAAAGAEGGPQPVFDVVSIQFALHYACGGEAELERLLRNVDRLLAPEGGTLLVTTTDARCLRHHLRHHQGEREFGNAVYRVQLSPEAAAAGPGLDSLGLCYTFSLASAVEACDEYVVHLPSLRRLAKDVAGLRLVRHLNFGALAHDYLPRFGHLLEPLQVGQVSEEEWEAIQLYSVLVFQR